MAKYLLHNGQKKMCCLANGNFLEASLKAMKLNMSVYSVNCLRNLAYRLKLVLTFVQVILNTKMHPYEMRAYFVLHEHQEIKWVMPEVLSAYDMPDPDRPIVEKLLEINFGK
jgi:hypothetical protein